MISVNVFIAQIWFGERESMGNVLIFVGNGKRWWRKDLRRDYWAEFMDNIVAVLFLSVIGTVVVFLFCAFLINTIAQPWQILSGTN